MKQFILFLIILFANFSALFAQESNGLHLKLVDQTGGLLEKATATLKDRKGFTVTETIKSQLGRIEFSSLNEGSYLLEISSQGFKSISQSINVQKGKNFLEIVFEIETINETVSIELSPREKRFADATNKIFTEEDLKNLPNDSEQIKKELQRRYGDDVILRVNGFTGGQFPDKSQIASISVILSPIDAEFHFVGKTLVNITTKVIRNKKWTGFLSFNFADSKFNARNSFARQKLPFQSQNFYFWINPPSIGKNTSLSFSVSGTTQSNESVFLGQLPSQPNNVDRTEENLNLSPSLTLNQNLGRNNTLYANYEFRQNRGKQNGLGPFDLSERAYDTLTFTNSLKVSESATIGKYSNQIRFEYRKNNLKITPDSFAPTVIVLNSFNKGGAGNQAISMSEKASIINILTFEQNKHLIKVGVELEFERIKYDISSNTNGKFVFSNTNDFKENRPLIYEQRKGIASSQFSQINAVLFFQDYFSLSRNFQVGVGGRWEFQSKVKDYNNISPRLSFVWSPEKTGKLILRGGFGSLFSYLDTSFFSTIIADNGQQSEELRVIKPGFPNPFEQGIILPQIEKPSISRLDKTKNPEIYLSFFGAIYNPFDRFKLISAYIISRGTHQPRIRDLNYLINGVRPNPNFGQIKLYEFAGNANANLFSIKSELKIKGFAINTNYNLLNSTTDFNDGGLPTNNNNLRVDFGAANDDRRHELNFDANFTLYKFIKYKPFYNVDFYVNSSLKSGLPYNLTTGKDNNNDGVINDRPPGINRNSEREGWSRQTDLRINWKPIFTKKDKVNGSFSALNKMNFTLTIQNIFNQNNKRNFVGNQSSSFYQQATTSDIPRSIQFGLNYLF